MAVCFLPDKLKMASFVKPSVRYATSDWFTANYTMATNAERERKASHDTRQESVFLRNETDNRTKWDQLDTNLRLADRVDQVREMKILLEKTLVLLDREIGGLSDSKVRKLLKFFYRYIVC